MSKEHQQEQLYFDYVQSMISWKLNHYWKPTNSQRGHIWSCWNEGRKPEVVASEIISGIRDAELQLEPSTGVRNPDSWTECPHCGLIHDPKLTRC